MLEKTPQNSESYETLKTIEKQGLNAKRVVENLLSFTRFSEHKEENMDINKNIEAVLAVVGNTLSINKIKVQKNYQICRFRSKAMPENYNRFSSI